MVRFCLMLLVLSAVVAPAMALQVTDGTEPAPAPATLAGKIVVIAGAVTLLVQGAKRVLDAFGVHIGGQSAVVLNILTTLAGNLASADPGQVFPPAFLITLILTVAGAAGLHDVLKRVGSGPAVPASR